MIFWSVRENFEKQYLFPLKIREKGLFFGEKKSEIRISLSFFRMSIKANIRLISFYALCCICRKYEKLLPRCPGVMVSTHTCHTTNLGPAEKIYAFIELMFRIFKAICSRFL